MHDPSRTNQKNIEENAILKQRIQKLEASGSVGRRSEEYLRESEERFRKEQKFSQLLFDTSPAFIVAIGSDGKTLMMNQALLNALEYTAEEIKGADYLTTFVPEEDRKILAGVFQKIIREGKATVNENRIRSRSGRTYLVEWQGRPAILEGGELDFFVGVGIDITARRQAEEALQESEVKYRSLFENAIEGIFRTTPEGRIVTANRAAARILGYESPEELISTIKDIRSQVYAYQEDRDEAVGLLRKQGFLKDFELQWRHKNGSIIQVILNFLLVRNDQGNILYYEGTIQDITERKRVQEALQESEKKYSSIFENAVEGIFQTNLEGRYISANPALARIFGYGSPEDMMSSVTDIGKQLDVDPEQRKERLRLLDEKGLIENYQAQMYRKDGSVFWVSISVRLVRDDAGNPLCYEGFATDITIRKQTEDALIEKTHFLGGILESTPNLIYIYDLYEQRNLFTNREIVKFLGYTSEQIQTFGSTLFQNILHPDDAPFVAKHHAKCDMARDNEILEIEYRMKHADGQWHWLRSRDIIFSRNQKGKGQQILGVAEDITTRKQLEDALRDSEEKFSNAFNFAPSMMSISSIEEGRYFDVNTRFLEAAGFTREEVIGKTSTELGIIEPASRELLKRKLINDGRVAGMELQLRNKNGQEIICIYHGEIIYFDEKRYLISLAEDITERKRAEEALLESEARYRVLFEGSTHGVLAFDLETGRLAFANPSICRMLGYSEVELLQLSIADVHPKDSLEQITIEFESLRQGEKKLSSALPCLRKDNAVFYADIAASDTIIINDRRYLVGFFTDVTERKHAEEELKCYAKELEDANTALRVFMNRRDHDQKMLEERLQINIEDIVVPYLKKLNETNLDSRQKNYLSVLESNLNNIVSPYLANLSATYKNLTPQEIQIANLIKQGMNTKDIAELLCTSVHTIGTHRNNIRKKLNLRNSKVNLRSSLLSFS